MQCVSSKTGKSISHPFWRLVATVETLVSLPLDLSFSPHEGHHVDTEFTLGFFHGFAGMAYALQKWMFLSGGGVVGLELKTHPNESEGDRGDSSLHGTYDI